MLGAEGGEGGTRTWKEGEASSAPRETGAMPTADSVASTPTGRLPPGGSRPDGLAGGSVRSAASVGGVGTGAQRPGTGGEGGPGGRGRSGPSSAPGTKLSLRPITGAPALP